MGRMVVEWYRATCFNRPVGPWRDNKQSVRRDLIEMELGSYDDRQQFYITVPGGVETLDEWVQFEERGAA